MALPQNDPVILRLFYWLTEIFFRQPAEKRCGNPIMKSAAMRPRRLTNETGKPFHL